MARLQILELPEGPDDSRPPFVLVIDQAPRAGALFQRFRDDMEMNEFLAARLGARSVLVFEDTIEVPANEVTLPDPRALVAEAELRFERDEMRRNYDGACRTIADLHAAATGRAGMGPVRGVVEDVEDVRQRAEQAELQLKRFAEAQQQELVDRMDEITDALGFDRLRDWGEIVSAIKLQRRINAEGGHLFGEPGFVDPLRCARCRMFHTDWVRRGTRCDAVRAEKGGE